MTNRFVKRSSWWCTCGCATGHPTCSDSARWYVSCEKFDRSNSRIVYDDHVASIEFGILSLTHSNRSLEVSSRFGRAGNQRENNMIVLALSEMKCAMHTRSLDFSSMWLKETDRLLAENYKTSIIFVYLLHTFQMYSQTYVNVW